MTVKTLLGWLSVLFLCVAQAAEQTVIVPTTGNNQRPVNPYIKTLLTRSFELIDVALTVRFSDVPVNEKRAINLLQENRLINLAWVDLPDSALGPLHAFETPVFQGIHGTRLFLIRADDQARFNQIESLQQLAELSALQFHGWSDYKVLTDNGLSVEGRFDRNDMFKALRSGFGDYFPRSAIAINREWREQGQPDLAIEEGLALKYDSYYRFVINPTNHTLKAQLSAGLAQLVKSGEYDRIFAEFHAERLTDLNIKNRRILALTRQFE